MLTATLGQVTDARATMAVYRIHRKTWDKGFPTLSSAQTKRKRPITEADLDSSLDTEHATDDADAPAKKPPTARLAGEGRKGVSSGLSVIVKRKETKTKDGWWKELSKPMRL